MANAAAWTRTRLMKLGRVGQDLDDRVQLGRVLDNHLEPLEADELALRQWDGWLIVIEGIYPAEQGIVTEEDEQYQKGDGQEEKVDAVFLPAAYVPWRLVLRRRVAFNECRQLTYCPSVFSHKPAPLHYQPAPHISTTSRHRADYSCLIYTFVNRLVRRFDKAVKPQPAAKHVTT